MMLLRTLLEAAPSRHRRVVAAELGLRRQATANEIAAALSDEARLAGIVERLPARPRRLLAAAAFDGGRIAAPTPWQLDSDASTPLELERRGLVFAFAMRWQREYRVPADLMGPLRQAIVARHAAGIRGARAARLVGAPLGTAHDAASVCAHLTRSPARVKADGDLYQRAWPKLVAALPPLEDAFDRVDALRVRRLDLALRFLRDEGLLRIRVDDRPGGDARRELVPAGDLAGVLAAEPAALRERIVAVAADDPDVRAATSLAGALRGRTVELASFGRALAALLGDIGVAIAAGWSPPVLALVGAAPAWLAGELQLGLGEDGAVRALAAVPADPDGADAPLAVCQSTFEVVLLRRPTPAERLALELACEPVSGQAHVFRLTAASTRTAARALGSAEAAIASLRRLAGELPQNVERCMVDWSGSSRSFRLRSALFLDARDAATADALAAGPLRKLAVERLGDRFLAVRARDVARVEHALAAAGHMLEPGLDRVSGAWYENAAPDDSPGYRWERPDRDARRERNWGEQVSTLPRAS